MECLDAKIIRNYLDNSLFSKNILIYPSLPSTNNTGKELFKEGACDGTVILAEEQTAGRGRMDRQWLSPSHKNILVSILLKPDIKVENIFSLTLALAVAGIDAIQNISGLSPMIKWPNDIYLGYKKLGGILTEFKVRGKTPVYVILGMGLNVNWNPDKNMLFQSTSILKETGRVTSRSELMAGILNNFRTMYDDIINEKMDEFNNKINRFSLLTGKEVSVDTGEEKIRGKALGIDAGGGLILKVQGGEVKIILNGDVSIRF